MATEAKNKHGGRGGGETEGCLSYTITLSGGQVHLFNLNFFSHKIKQQSFNG